MPVAVLSGKQDRRGPCLPEADLSVGVRDIKIGQQQNLYYIGGRKEM